MLDFLSVPPCRACMQLAEGTQCAGKASIQASTPPVYVQERPESSLLAAFERCTEMVVGKYSWLARLPPELRDDLDKHRSYNGKSPRALLRVMRNKKAHYGKLSGSLKAEFVPLPEGFFEWGPSSSYGALCGCTMHSKK